MLNLLIQETIMKQGKTYEEAKLDFRTTKQQHIRDNTFETGTTQFVKEEEKSVIQIRWIRYGEFLEVEYEIKAIQ